MKTLDELNFEVAKSSWMNSFLNMLRFERRKQYRGVLDIEAEIKRNPQYSAALFPEDVLNHLKKYKELSLEKRKISVSTAIQIIYSPKPKNNKGLEKETESTPQIVVERKRIATNTPNNKIIYKKNKSRDGDFFKGAANRTRRARHFLRPDS